MKVLTFGEIMLRLKAPGHERFFQSPMLEATFGGGEANVAVSLANYGMDAEFLTVLPQNDIADACIRELRYFGVDTKKIVHGDGRMGIYYLEAGANQLPSKVVYDRAYSSISLAKPGDIDWDKAFDGVDWFHITGITPAISESAMALSLESVKEAKKRNITVSCDLNYRKNLWKYGKKASEIMREMAKYVDVAIANEEDVQKSLEITVDVNIESGELDREKYCALGDREFPRHPLLRWAERRGRDRARGLCRRSPTGFVYRLVDFASFVRRSLVALVNSFLSRFLRYLAYQIERRLQWKQEKTYAPCCRSHSIPESGRSRKKPG